MSLLGLIAHRGSRVTVHHHLDTEETGGESTRSYPTSDANVGMLLEDLSDELVRRVFGQETKATLRALVHVDTPTISDDDGVVVTSGPHAGESFRVAKQLLNRAGVSPHRELALERTSEVIP